MHCVITVNYTLQQVKKQQVKNIVTGIKRKQPVKNVKNKTKAQSESPQRKLQKTCEVFEKNLHTLSPSPTRSDDNKSSEEDDDNKDDNKNSDVETEASNDNVIPKNTSLSRCNSPDPVECKTIENISTSDLKAQKLILDLFLVEMPKDFFQFYEFCESISKDDALSACKAIRLKLVGPFDVLEGKIKYSENKSDQDRFLTHWRYYYDPPEFQVRRRNEISANSILY